MMGIICSIQGHKWKKDSKTGQDQEICSACGKVRVILHDGNGNTKKEDQKK